MRGKWTEQDNIWCWAMMVQFQTHTFVGNPDYKATLTL